MTQPSDPVFDPASELSIDDPATRRALDAYLTVRAARGTDEQREAWSALAAQLAQEPAEATLVAASARTTTRLAGGRASERRTPWMRLGVGVAVAAGLAAMAAIAFAPGLAGRRTTTVTSETRVATREFRTGPGERATITLADGTQVMLNVDTRLRVAADFGARARVVHLDGEAQFVVTHDPARPFSVEADGTIVRDLATTFVVRAYRGDATRVAVRDGRVSVQSPMVTSANAVALHAGQSAVVSATNVAVSSALDPSAFSWTTGRLVLRAVPLGVALGELRRWYGLDFRAADSALLNARVSATLPSTFNPYLLDGLADVIGARLERSGSVVTFVPRSSR